MLTDFIYGHFLENKALDDLTLDEYKEECPAFEADIYGAISMKTCVERRLTLGAPGEAVMRQVIAENKAYLEREAPSCDQK